MTPINVTVTGAAGEIGYSLVFRIAAGQMLGSDQPVSLKLLETPEAVNKLEGVAMELNDCAFPLLHSIDVFDKADDAFNGANMALLVGARTRDSHMDRSDLLEVNGHIFRGHGQSINHHAADDVRVITVGNPANTNALIAKENAPDVPANRFTALTRLDHNRAVFQLAHKAGVPVKRVQQMTIWGNHSDTQYPDIFNASIEGVDLTSLTEDQAWLEDYFIPTVANRGKAVINARGRSSAASAASATIDHMRDWFLGTPEDDWTSVALPSDGSYGVPEGLIFSFPTRSSQGEWEIVQDLALNSFAQQRIALSIDELVREREEASSMGFLSA